MGLFSEGSQEHGTPPQTEPHKSKGPTQYELYKMSIGVS